MPIFIPVKKTAAFIFIVVFISACSLIGVHFKLHNPKHAGKFPKKTEARSLLGNQESKYRTCFDVMYYNLDVVFGMDLSKDNGISGTAIMKAVATKALDTIQLDANRNMKIFSVTGFAFNSAGVTGGSCMAVPDTLHYFRKENALFVVFSSHVEKGFSMQVTISYAVDPDEAQRPPWRGGFVRKKDEQDKQWWGVACQSEGASMWWPCKDVVNDEPATCDISLTVPEEYVAVSNGRLTYTASTMTPGMKVYGWHVSYPINLYDMTFYIGKFRLIHDTYLSKVTGDTLSLNHYVLEQHYDKAVEHFKQLKAHLAVYEELFGPYPFYRDGFKLVESPYAGMEHQTAIAYGNEFKNNSLGFDYIILHETAHEWWGNSLTAYDLAEAWLHEGFATYAECLYVEKTQGYAAYLQYLRTYKWTIINRRPMIGPYGFRYFNYKDGDIYTKGAMILHTLRMTIGNDSLFFDIIKTFASQYAYKNVTTNDFMSVVNQKTGQDYKWFFDQYCHNRFVPELEYCEEKGQLYYRYNPEYTNTNFHLPVSFIAGNKKDTVTPSAEIASVKISNSAEFYWQTGVLVKFTENKKLVHLYRKQTQQHTAN
jgi:aminopeptidase N